MCTAYSTLLCIAYNTVVCIVCNVLDALLVGCDLDKVVLSLSSSLPPSLPPVLPSTTATPPQLYTHFSSFDLAACLIFKHQLHAQVSGKESLPSRKPTWDRVDQDKASAAANRTPLQEKHCNSAERG